MNKPLSDISDERKRILKNVLIVEDEDAIRESICLVLGEEGYNCTAAPTGNHAVQEAKNSPFNLMIVDFHMPGMDGIQTLKQVRSVQPDIKVILITCYSESDAIPRALAAGAKHYLFKPLDFDELLHLVNNIV